MSPFTIALILAVGLVARWLIEAARGGSDGRLLASRDAQIQRLREEVDVLTSEVRRLGEEQSFMVKLLSEGAKRGEALPPPGVPPPTRNPENS